MKKLIASVTFMVLLFIIGVNSVMAVDPVVINCAFLKTCKVYVDDSYDNSVTPSDGSLARPYKTITEAVAKFKTSDVYNGIYVAGGTYDNETLPWEFDSSLANTTLNLKGGFNADFSVENADTYKTYIKAGSVPRILKVNDKNLTLTGFDISGVSGGIAMGAVAVSNKGATSFNVNITNNVFHNNSSNIGSSAIYLAVGGANTAVVENNKFYSNTDQFGSVVRLEGGVDAKKNVFYANSNSSIINCNNGAKVYNNYVLSNTADYAVLAYGSCTLQHNVISFNTINTGNDFAALSMWNNGNVISNNLITNNSGKAIAHYNNDSSTWEYNAFYSNGVNAATYQNNNLYCDPLFPSSVNKTKPEDVKLGAGSECIDSGKILSSVTTDYFGTARPIDGDGDGTAKSDPGAYEAPAATVSVPEINGLGVTLNPFSPNGDGNQDTTTITFALSADAQVTVDIKNSADVIVKSLLSSESKSKGNVSVTWDGKEIGGSTVPNGMYKVYVFAVNTGGSSNANTTVKVDNSVPTGLECAGFSDLLRTDPVCPAVTYVVSKGIFEGYPDGTFGANKIINRVETTKVTLIGFNKTILAADGSMLGFSDVDPAAWYMSYVRTAKSLGVLEGYLDGTLKPAQQINRVEMLKVFFNTSGIDLSGVVVNSAPYPDTPISAATNWYLKFVKYSKDHALVDAAANGNFYPAEGMKRGDVAELFYRYSQI
jgi:hypothetical protein